MMMNENIVKITCCLTFISIHFDKYSSQDKEQQYCTLRTHHSYS